MTVKGLEPEIQLLIKKHKQDVQRIKAEHQVMNVGEMKVSSDVAILG